MTDYPKDVVDERGNVHVLKEMLGEGGQGIVFATTNPDIAVKLIAGGNEPASERRGTLLERLTYASGASLIKGDAARNELRARLETVRTLPHPDDLHLAEPLAMLRGHVGYTMRLLRDMVPIRTLILPPENIAEEYLATGGLRRRLRLLAKAAEILGRLHSIPLVYADVSPNNVFISSSAEASEVWLIDADNLHFESAPGPQVYTPGFGAPEIVAGRAPVSTLSDGYAFAVLAFYVLAQIHPFLGNLVEEGGWEESVDLEKQAYAGELPWVEDDDDDSNRSDKGIPRELVLTPRLTKLFQQTFGVGRQDAASRPSMLEWAEVLHQCADWTVACEGCGSTFYAPREKCPWCDSSPSAKLLYGKFYVWDPEFNAESYDAVLAGSPVWHPLAVCVLVLGGTYDAVLAGSPVWHLCMDRNKATDIARHAAEPSLLRDGDPPVMTVEVKHRSIRLTPHGDWVVYAYLPREGRTEVIDTAKELPLPLPDSEWLLHFGSPDQIHRVAYFTLIASD